MLHYGKLVLLGLSSLRIFFSKLVTIVTLCCEDDDLCVLKCVVDYGLISALYVQLTTRYKCTNHLYSEFCDEVSFQTFSFYFEKFLIMSYKLFNNVTIFINASQKIELKDIHIICKLHTSINQFTKL